MQRFVSTIAGFTLLVSALISGIPPSTDAADAENVPVASWPHTIATDEVTIVVYPPQAITWKEHRTLEARMAVSVTKQGAKEQYSVGCYSGHEQFRNFHEEEIRPWCIRREWIRTKWAWARRTRGLERRRISRWGAPR